MKKQIHTLLAVIAALTFGHVVSAEAKPPNIVLIFADDLGYGDIGSFNKNCPFKTPNLDRMAEEGARLTSFYVPTPYCAPSRGTMLTGRYPFRHTVMGNPAPDAGLSNFGLPASEITIAEVLKSEGYATAAFGKWHLGHKPKWLPRTQGFDEYFGILYSNDMFPVQLIHNEEVVEYPVVQATLTKRYIKRAIQFIEQHKDEPFFVYLPHAMPHKPLAVSDDFYTPTSRDNLYADVIAELDSNVGQVLAKIKQLGLDDNTLVIFTSDNGPWYGGSTGGLRGMKSMTWEGGLRVPMIARLPGVIPAGVVNNSPAASIDIFPTLCKLVGVPVPDDRVIDGRDLMPLLKDAKVGSPHKAIYGMHGNKLSMIRAGKWKLHVRAPSRRPFAGIPKGQWADWIDPRGPDGVALLAPYEQPGLDQYPGLSSGDAPKAMMLFDLDVDRGEQHDVADQHPEVVKELMAMFEKTSVEVPVLPSAISDYLFTGQKKGRPRTLMRLIGGDLRYDRVPESQRHLLAPEGKPKNDSNKQ
ncbi:MAG: sulfatase [Verrucomicrobiota bacterium]